MANKFNVTKFRSSPFMAALLAPLPDAEALKLAKEARAVCAERFHRNWIVAEKYIAAREAQHYEYLENTLYGDKTLKDSGMLRDAAFNAIERMIFTPSPNKNSFQTKKSTAAKGRAKQYWPESWVKAFAEEEAFFASRRKAAA